MKEKIIKRIIVAVLAFILLVLGMIGILRFVVGGGEDSWICVQGEWVRHGVPAGPPPTTGCGEE